MEKKTNTCVFCGEEMVPTHLENEEQDWLFFWSCSCKGDGNGK